nr:hypothetical protein [Tanacetum cinerariifolium]
DTRKNIVDLEAFREMLHISPRVTGQYFAELPFEEEILDFFGFLDIVLRLRYLLILRLSQAQILWGLYHRRNVDYAFLIWEDFVYQVEHKNQKKSNEMYYPRFTKVIIHHFMMKEPSIPRRNKLNWHYVRDDILFSTIKVVSRYQNTQQYGTILPIEFTTEDIRNTKAYKEYYACATGEAAPKPKASARRKRGGSDSSTTPPTPIATPTPITTVQGGSSTDEGTGSKPRVLDVPSDESGEEISCNSFDDEDVDDQTKGRDDNEGEKTNESNADDDDQDDTKKDNNDDDDDKEEISKIDKQKATENGEDDDEETKSDRESEEEETKEEAEKSFDLIPRTPEDSEDDGNGEEDQGLRISEEERIPAEEEADELYHRVKSLEVNFSEFIRTNQFPEAVSNILGTQSRQLSASESAFVEEPVQTICQMEEPSHPVFETGVEDQPIVQTSQHPEWFSQPRKPPTPDRDWNKTLPAQQTDARSSFNELLNTPIDFSNFIMNRLDVDTLTPELLAGPTYELMRGSCNSLTELEYHLDEVYKATTDQLDWVNPEGQQYPHNLLLPLSLIPDNRGRRVIPFEHFIHNDLAYLWGGASSRKYTASMTKTKTTDYGHIKVKSYQKRLNLTKPDTYRSDLKRQESYNAYSYPRGFIYQNKDKKNKLMRIDELHKFSDETLNDVRDALDDRLKGIRMQYLPTTIWRKRDKDRAAAMIQAIDKMLKTKRIMRSLERFIGGRQYEGDF